MKDDMGDGIKGNSINGGMTYFITFMMKQRSNEIISLRHGHFHSIVPTKQINKFIAYMDIDDNNQGSLEDQTLMLKLIKHNQRAYNICLRIFGAYLMA